ncbi:DNA-binding protein [Streptomyces sp. NPDC085927]|uniref:nSTAND1 domain-containing NTPase n=1 Tax=Streptomyces sp. NPDC085927 TaxID=3365738 RepID=UPI0037D78F8D
MGRPETPVDPAAGPVQQFAYALRKLRREAGGISYREMSRRAHYSVTALSQAASGDQLPSLPLTLAYVKACGGAEDEWERRWNAVDSELAATVREDDAEPPYQGLARFEPSDHERFFGRDELVGELARTVAVHRFTAVFGPSGSGKSSLLRAGLVPRLRGGASAFRLAAIRLLAPGEHPLDTHAAVLGPPAGSGPHPPDTLLVVDQFEEVFTLCRDQAERTAFIDLLLRARDPDSGLRVVIAVRADFYGRCAEHRELARALREASVLVGPMNAAELRQVVVGPAKTAGLIVERALTARLVREVEDRPGGLPLLSHVLRETWLRRQGRTLTEDAYRAAGGLDGAVAQTAEDVFTRLPPGQAALARPLLLRLIAPGDGSPDTRRPVPRAELDIAGTDDVDEVLDRLARARLLTLDDDTVTLAHEALITAWPRLSGWIDEDRERLRAHRRLTEAARVWLDLDEDDGALYRGARLVTAEEIFRSPGLAGVGPAPALTPAEDAFLTASLAGRTRSRRRRHVLLATLCALLALALVAGATAWQQSRTSEARRIEAEAGRLAVVATGLRSTDPQRARRLSVAAWRLASTPETRSALLGALGQRERDVFVVPDDTGTASPGGTGDPSAADAAPAPSPDADRFLSADGRTLLSVSARGVTSWDVTAHRRTGIRPLPGADFPDAEVTTWTVAGPDNRTVALLENDGIRLWDVRGGRFTGRLATAPPLSAAFGPDGRTLLVEGWDEKHVGESLFEVWDIPRERRLLTLPGGERAMLENTAVSPDGRLITACTGERLVIRHLREQGGRPLRWPGSVPCARSSHAFTPDGRTVAFTTEDGFHLVDARTGRTKQHVSAPELAEFRFSPDGRFLLGVSLTDEILLWRLAAPESPALRYVPSGESPTDVRLDVDGRAIRYLSAGGTTVRTLSLDDILTSGRRGSAVDSARWSPDGQSLAVAESGGEHPAYLLADARGRETARLPGTPCPPVPREETDSLPVFDFGAEEEVIGAADSGVPVDCVDHLAFGADGRRLVYGALPQTPESHTTPQRVTVWDVRERRAVTTIDLARGTTPGKDDEMPSEVTGLAITADGRTLAVSRSGERSVLELWDVRRGTRLRTLSGFSGPGPLWHPDGTTVVSRGGSVADVPSGTVRDLVLSGEEVTALAFSRTGDRLAVGDELGRVTVWNGTLRERIDTVAALDSTPSGEYDEAVSALAFSPDGRTLAVGGDNGTVQLWDAASRRLTGTPLPTPGETVFSLTFDASGDRLRTTTGHLRAHTTDLAPDRVADRLCASLKSGLSQAEWRSYLPTVPYRRTC